MRHEVSTGAAATGPGFGGRWQSHDLSGRRHRFGSIQSTVARCATTGALQNRGGKLPAV